MRPLHCYAQRVESIAINGAIGNPARFWGHYFITGSAVSRLRVLAAALCFRPAHSIA